MKITVTFINNKTLADTNFVLRNVAQFYEAKQVVKTYKNPLHKAK